MKQLRVGLDPEHYQAFLKGGLLLTEHLTVPAGTRLLRIGVEQRESGRVGTLDLPLTAERQTRVRIDPVASTTQCRFRKRSLRKAE